MGASMSLSHLRALTDERGVFEHALLDVPRPEHGYCTDDVARALIVVVREAEHSAEQPAEHSAEQPAEQPAERSADLAALTELYLAFLESAVAANGLARNRMDRHGEWVDEPGMGDWWGRLLWALGTAAARAVDARIRTRALRAFHRAAGHDTPHLRTMAFAALGAAEVLAAHPGDRAATNLLRALIKAVPPTPEGSWRWPEQRLAYANASIAEAMISAGSALDDHPAADRGLGLLAFLLTVETVGEHLSVTGSSGRGPGDRAPQFDQQPIEVAALADACARAYRHTGDPSWLSGVDLAWRWFTGDNDTGVPMIDEESGAGFDGLERDGRNENRGAESTLAALSTRQQMRRLAAPVGV